MKNILIDIYLAKNLGDDLFLDIIAKEYPKCKFTLNQVRVDYKDFLLRYKNIKLKETSVNKCLQKLRIRDYISNPNHMSQKYDALVFMGGSIFMEAPYHEPVYKYRMNLVKQFKLKNKPVFVIGSNFGPCYTKEFFDDYETFFKQCDDVCFRDLYSYNLFKHLTNVRYAPDVVFKLDIDSYIDDYNRNIIGYSIIDVSDKDGIEEYYDSYIESTVKSINLMVSKGKQCVLMSFCENEGDLKTINEIMGLLDSKTLEYVDVYEYKGNLEEAMNLINKFELFIAARFHATIISLISKTSVIPVIYSKKTLNMLADMRIKNKYVEMNNLELLYDEEFIDYMNKTSLNIDLNKVKKKSKQQFDGFNKWINKNKF